MHEYVMRNTFIWCTFVLIMLNHDILSVMSKHEDFTYINERLYV